MGTKTLISKHFAENDMSFSDLSAFEKLKRRFNSELKVINSNLKSAVKETYSDEKVDRMAKKILNKYLDYVVKVEDGKVVTSKTIWFLPSEYLDLTSYEFELKSKFSSPDFSKVTEDISEKILLESWDFLEKVIIEINEKMVQNVVNATRFSLGEMQIRKFSYDKDYSDKIEMQVSFDIDVVWNNRASQEID